MKNMKNIRKIIKILKNIFILIGLPTIFIYVNQMRSEQMKSKDQEIALLKTRVETAQDSQVDGVWEKFKSLKEYSETEIKDLNIKLNESNVLNDSLKKYISGPFLMENNRVILTKAQAKAVIIDLITGDKNGELVHIYEKMEKNHKSVIKNKDDIIQSQNQIIHNQNEIIKKERK